MKSVVLISKGGAVKSEKIKTFKLADIYKKCKFRKKDDFNLRHTWNYKNNWFSVFAKDKGRTNSENKYDLPPPIDTQLYFGNMIVLKHKNKKIKENEVVDTDKNEWLKVYEHLFGGFDDLGEEESQSEEEGDDDNSSDLIEEQDDDDEEAEYGGNTEDEMEAQFEEDDDDDDQLDEDDDQLDDDEPASELSEEEYSY